MTSRLLYDNLPVYVQWFDTLNGAILAHLCEAIQPEFNLIQQILREYEFFLDLNSPLNDNYLDFLQQFVGAAPIAGRYLGIGLNPEWPIIHKKRVLSQLFQYWQRKGTENAVRKAIALWLQWPEAESLDFLGIRYPFGSQVSSRPDSWWSWGVQYDTGFYQSYLDNQFLGGGDRPGFNYQPPGIRLLEFVNRWQWQVEVWSPRILDTLFFPVVQNSLNNLSPGNVWLHFNPGLNEFPTWNRLFNDYSTLSSEIFPALTSDSVFQWVQTSFPLYVIGLDPSENLKLEVDYQLQGYNWAGLDLWPFPGLSQRTIKKIEIQDHEYFFLGWQWQDDLFSGTSSVLDRSQQYEDVEIIVEGSWGTRYGDLSALTPFYLYDIVNLEIVTSDNYDDIELFWTEIWNQGWQWFYGAKIEIIPVKVDIRTEQINVDLIGTIFPYSQIITTETEVWRDVPAGFSSQIQLWGGINSSLFFPNPDFTKIPVVEPKNGLAFSLEENQSTWAFYLGGFIEEFNPPDQAKLFPAELWGTQFLEIIPIQQNVIEQQVAEALDQRSNSSVSMTWAILGSEDNPSPQPWVWVFNQSESTANPPIVIYSPGLDITSAADYYSWHQIWYFPDKETIIFPPQETGNNLIGDYPFIFNQGHQWLASVHREKVREEILNQPEFRTVIYPSLQWFYPPVDEIIGYEWVEALNPNNKYGQQPVITVSSAIAESWNAGIPWIYRNEQGKILDTVETESELKFLEAFPWFYPFKQWIESIAIEDDNVLTYYLTPGIFWYVNRVWQEAVEIILSEANSEQCFLGKIYDVQTDEIWVEKESEDVFMNLILESRQFNEPDLIIRPKFDGIFPGSQWSDQWLLLSNSTVSLFEIDLDLQTEAFGEIDLQSWEEETFEIDLGTFFSNLVYNIEAVNDQEKIKINQDSWYAKDREAVIKFGELITVIEFEKQDCAQYSDNWLSTCFWAKLNAKSLIQLEKQPVYTSIPLCNIPAFYSDRTIFQLTEEWVVIDPDLTIFEEFPDFRDWFIAENWSLLTEVEGEVFKHSPIKILWEKDSIKNVYYEPGAILLLEFVLASMENENQTESAQIRSVALLFQDRCIHFQTCELHGKLNTRSDYTFGVRYQIDPKFERENYITVDAEILI